MTPADPTPFHLTWQGDHLAGLARDLRLAVNGGLAPLDLNYLLNRTDHTARRGCKAATNPGGALAGVNASLDWYCLQPVDATATNWNLQSISGTEDASPTGKVDNRRAIAIGWHHVPEDASRLSFLIPTAVPNGSTGYVNVYLVRPVHPTSGHLSYEAIPSGADGLVWYGHYLYLADRRNGILVFDMNNLLDLALKGNDYTDDKTGWSGNQYHSPGYRFVLPEIGRWSQTANGSLGCNHTSVPCYDYAGLDRSTSPPKVATGEYCNIRVTPTHPVPDPCAVGRVARWNMNRLANHHGTISAPVDTFHQTSPFTQGGITFNSCYYFNRSRGPNRNGFLIHDRPGRPPLSDVAGIGLQDLYRIENELWTVTEWPGEGKRILYGALPPPRCSG